MTNESTRIEKKMPNPFRLGIKFTNKLEIIEIRRMPGRAVINLAI